MPQLNISHCGKPSCGSHTSTECSTP
jgi:hypothetical protein